MKKLICLLILSVPVVFSQVTETPLEMNNYDSLTSYSQMLSYLYRIVEEDNRIKMEFIGESVEGRKIPVGIRPDLTQALGIQRLGPFE